MNSTSWLRISPRAEARSSRAIARRSSISTACLVLGRSIVSGLLRSSRMSARSSWIVVGLPVLGETLQRPGRHTSAHPSCCRRIRPMVRSASSALRNAIFFCGAGRFIDDVDWPPQIADAPHRGRSLGKSLHYEGEIGPVRDDPAAAYIAIDAGVSGIPSISSIARVASIPRVAGHGWNPRTLLPLLAIVDPLSQAILPPADVRASHRGWVARTGSAARRNSVENRAGSAEGEPPRSRPPAYGPRLPRLAASVRKVKRIDRLCATALRAQLTAWS